MTRKLRAEITDQARMKIGLGLNAQVLFFSIITQCFKIISLSKLILYNYYTFLEYSSTPKAFDKDG